MRIIILASLLAACGSVSDSGGDDSPATTDPSQAPTPTEPTSYMVAAAADLPVCDAAHNNHLVYVAETQQFMACQSTTWGVISVKGEKGDPGADGTDNRIIASIHCTGMLQDTSLIAKYDVSVFGSGDIFVYGAIVNSVQQIGAPAFYSSKQNGAATAAVNFTDDYEDPHVSAWWSMSLDRTTLVTTVDYNNVALPGGKRTWTMTSDKCIKNSYE